MPDTFVKDPDATLDYSVDWSSWLADGETISTLTTAVDEGDVTIDADSDANGITTTWVSDGTLNTIAKVRHRITTSAGRTDDRTITLVIRNR